MCDMHGKKMKDYIIIRRPAFFYIWERRISEKALSRGVHDRRLLARYTI